MLSTLVHGTQRIGQKHGDLCDHGNVDGRRLTKPGGQGEQRFPLLEHGLTPNTDVPRRPPLTLGQ
jgi:hypothetical protein